MAIEIVTDSSVPADADVVGVLFRKDATPAADPSGLVVDWLRRRGFEGSAGQTSVANVAYVAMNQAKAPMNRLIVRQAVAHGLDRNAVVIEEVWVGCASQVRWERFPIRSHWGAILNCRARYTLRRARSSSKT